VRNCTRDEGRSFEVGNQVLISSQPISAITHLAPVARIEPHGDSGKYKVIFSEPAKKIGPIPFGNAPSGAMQGPRYTTYKKLETAKTMMDLVGKM
jgi:hypothetical protein